MKYQSRRYVQVLLAIAVLCVPLMVVAQSTGMKVSNWRPSVVSGIVTTTNGTSIYGEMQPSGPLVKADYQKAYDQALALYKVGFEFRRDKLSLPPKCTTIAECLQNYSNINATEVFYKYCKDYTAINRSGGCTPDDIRTNLVQARDLFGFLATAQPADMRLTQGLAQKLGQTGLLSATRELASIHLIFGNEFMVDALDYRFSGQDPRADAIIGQEIDLLLQAVQQFTLASETISHAYNDNYGTVRRVNAIDFFTPYEFDLFVTATERLITALSEVAARYRLIGQDQRALDLYATTLREQYVQALALATSAASRNTSFFANGGWRLLNNLERMRAQAQVINEGINPFGFANEYVPLQSYAELRENTLTFLANAERDEDRANQAQREFDQNATSMKTEIRNLRSTYDSRLVEVCGPQQDFAKTCDGGLMEQNRLSIVTTLTRIGLAHQRAENVVKQIEDVETRANREETIRLKTGEELQASRLAAGVISSYRVTESNVDTSSREIYGGAEVRVTAQEKYSLNPFKIDVSVSSEQILSGGVRWTNSSVSSSQTTWDPSQIELAKISGLEAYRQAVADAKIIDIQRDYEIRNLLRDQAEKLIEIDIALDEYNELVGQHNNLVAQYHYWVNQQQLAQEDLVNSYLSNPAYRILRDSLTIEAARNLGMVAQFAYLTAKAAEYDALEPVGFINTIYKARTADDIRNFMDDLVVWRSTRIKPGALNRYPYRISIAKDMLGLTDEYLDPNGTMTPTQRNELRYQRFKAYLQEHRVLDASGKLIKIEFSFTTSLLNNRIFSSNIWNNRIAGVGEPLAANTGVSVKLTTRQFANLGNPNIQMTYEGQATFRTRGNRIISYAPDTARLAGYKLPENVEEKKTTATFQAGITGGTEAIPNSSFVNLSVAASNWTMAIDMTQYANRNLDPTQLEDIVIFMDTTAYALPSNVQQAQTDQRRFEAAFVQP